MTGSCFGDGLFVAFHRFAQGALLQGQLGCRAILHAELLLLLLGPLGFGFQAANLLLRLATRLNQRGGAPARRTQESEEQNDDQSRCDPVPFHPLPQPR